MPATVPTRSPIRRALLALLATVTLFVTAAPVAAAAAAEPAPVAAAAASRHRSAPDCVTDLVGRFQSLTHHPEPLAYHVGAGEEPDITRHYQGIARIPGLGPNYLVTSRNGNSIVPTAETRPGELLVVAFGTTDADGERWGSNRLAKGWDTSDTAPPYSDRGVKSILLDGNNGWPAYRHGGGLQMYGDVLVAGFDTRDPAVPATATNGAILFVDMADPYNPRLLSAPGFDHKASWVGIARLGDGRFLVLTSDHNSNPVYAYETNVTDLRDPDLTLTHVDTWWASENGRWPTGGSSPQTGNLVRDCNGLLYLLTTNKDWTVREVSGKDMARIWEVWFDGDGQMHLSLAAEKHMYCESEADLSCNFAAASGFHVSPSGELLLYAGEHANDGSGNSVRIGEFRDIDGIRAGSSAYVPRAFKGGPYHAEPGQPVALGVPATEMPHAGAFAELYDDDNFQDRSIVLDWDRRNDENFDDLDRHDGFRNKATSVRWTAPPGCELVLWKAPGFKGASLVLPGTGGPEAVADLKDRRFNDATQSVQFRGDTCDSGITGYAWDLDNDGAFEAPGKDVSFTPPGPGVHRVRVQVCSEWGTCGVTEDEVIVAGVPQLPATTATVDGTAGSNGWYRGPVTVTLAAAGSPVPHAVTYSATGANPIAETTVGGSSTSFELRLDGTTTVRFMATSTAGTEAEQTLTVRIDTVAPALTVRNPVAGARFSPGFALTVELDCADGNSGMAACTPHGTALDTSSPGSKVLVASATDGAGNTTVVEVPYTVTTEPAPAGNLVFVGGHDGSGGAVYRASADGSNLVRLIDDGDDPAWSPDGSRIAFTRRDGSIHQVFVMNADGTGVTRLTGNPTHAASPSWSADGTGIVYATHRFATGQANTISAVPAAGGASIVLVSHTSEELRSPVYAADGTVTYAAGARIYSVPATGVPAGELGTALLSGVGGLLDSYDLAWEPGTAALLAFVLHDRETQQSDLVLLSPGSGQDPVNLTGANDPWGSWTYVEAPREWDVQWLADGRILFSQDGDLYTMPAERGGPKTLAVDLPMTIDRPDAR